MAASYRKKPALEIVFNSEYCEISKSTYFKEHLRKAASENAHETIVELAVELAVLRSYVENQAILELILLYRASKCKQTKQRARQRGLFMDSYFSLFIRLLSVLVFLYVKMQTKQDQTVL